MVHIVEKSLVKDPQSRYRDAADMLQDVERLLNGEPTRIQLHPLVPDCDPKSLFRADFEWDLQSPPEALWPYVSNTERLNRAVGVPAVQYTSRRDKEGFLHKFGDFRMAGLHIAWEELPFEWIEGQRLGVLRKFSKGPFKWFLSVVETTRGADGGTHLKHSVRIAPRGLVGRLVAIIEVK